MRIWAFIAASAFLGAAAAQDLEREQRWAAEVTPTIVVGDPVQIKLPSGRAFLGLYAEEKSGRPAILLVHGIGVHPDHGVIGTLRTLLFEAGYTTLSIQMPVERADAAPSEYPPLFPEAAERIRAGAAWLLARHHPRLVLLSHSMGSRMANVYYERTPGAPFAAWLCLGLAGEFGRMGNVKVPVLDVMGENDLGSVLRDDWRRRLILNTIPGSMQLVMPGADHFYTGREEALARALEEFLSGIK